MQGILGLLFVVLLVLKIAAISGASWGLAISWWVVFAPLLVAAGIWVLLLLFTLLLAAVD